MKWNHKLAEERYYLGDEDEEKLARRVVRIISNGDQEYIDPFLDMIIKHKFIPAGRVLRNAGRPKGGMINCFFLDIEDDLFAITQWIANTMLLAAEGGGVGTNASGLRPLGDPIKGRGGPASGPISWLEIADFANRKIETGGQRRAALKADMSISHPDIERFIDAKIKDGILSHFNISVGITSQFMEAVKNDEEWSLTFREKEYKKVPARKLWKKILTNMLQYADPGIQYLDNLYTNNSWYVYPVRGTNPCGEVPLEHGGVCCLGSLVLPAFISNGDFNWKDFDQTIPFAVRFLDNVLDVNNFILQFNKDQAQWLRRIGLGTMGLADALFGLGIRYGSSEYVAFLDKLYERLRNTAYRASVELSKEKGAFPKFESAYLKSKFIRTLPRSIQRAIKENGIRNCTMLSQAPTGSTAPLVEVVEGIEPLSYKEAIRNDQFHKNEVSIHPLAAAGCKEEWFVDSTDITIEEHFEVQATVQKYIDGAVSKTINVPKDMTVEKIGDVLLQYLDDIKGVTVYRDGSKKGQPIRSCKSGTCDV